MLCRFLIPVVVVFLSSSFGATVYASSNQAGVIPDPQAEEIFISIYNLNFSRADSLTRNTNFISDTERIVVETFSLWWKGLTLPYPNIYLDSLERMCLELIGIYGDPQNLQRNDPFIVAIAGAFGIRICSIRDDKRLALRIFLRIRPTLVNIIYYYGSTPELMLVSGVYNLAAAGIRKNQFLLRPFFVFLPPSDEGIGKELLLKCTRSSFVPVSTEAFYFLYRIHEEINSEWKEAYKYSRWLTDQYPDNFIFAVNHILLLREMGYDTTVQSSNVRARVNASSLSPTQKFHILEELVIGKR